MDAETLLAAWRIDVDRRLDQLLPAVGQAPAALHEAMRYACLAPGKRVRPALCMSSAQAVGAAANTVLDAACALEMVHAFSLIHDDLPAIDDDALRRGRATVHIEFGEALAILAGDALFALAFKTLSEIGADAGRVNVAVRILADASGSAGLVGGEVMDVLAERENVGAESVEAIHRKKTAALISASCHIGGILGGATDEQCRTLAEFGEQIGLAFQIADDILNETSTAASLGKAAGTDFAKQKATYPSTIGFEQSKLAAKAALRLGLKALDSGGIASESLRVLASFAIEREN